MTATLLKATLRPACPICEGSLVPIFSTHGYTIVDCTRCGHRTTGELPAETHVLEVYSDDYFFGGGAGYSNYLQEGELLRQRGRWYADLLKRYCQPGQILDIGAAAGFFLQGFLDAGWQGMGLEPNAAMVRHGREQLGLDLRQGTLEDCPVEQTFDLISIVQVVGHLTQLHQAIQQVSEALNPRGFCLIESWNRASLTAKLFGRSWHEYSPPSVLHWFSPQGLENLLARHGLRMIGSGRPKKSLRADHAKSLLRHKLGPSLPGRLAALPLHLIPNRLVIPYPSEDLLWMLFQKA